MLNVTLNMEAPIEITRKFIVEFFGMNAQLQLVHNPDAENHTTYIVQYQVQDYNQLQFDIMMYCRAMNQDCIAFMATSPMLTLQGLIGSAAYPEFDASKFYPAAHE